MNQQQNSLEFGLDAGLRAGFAMAAIHPVGRPARRVLVAAPARACEPAATVPWTWPAGIWRPPWDCRRRFTYDETFSAFPTLDGPGGPLIFEPMHAPGEPIVGHAPSTLTEAYHAYCQNRGPLGLAPGRPDVEVEDAVQEIFFVVSARWQASAARRTFRVGCTASPARWWPTTGGAIAGAFGATGTRRARPAALPRTRSLRAARATTGTPEVLSGARQPARKVPDRARAF